MSETKRYKELIDWGYFRAVPIEDVAHSLGMEPDRYGKVPCPCHDDHHPSMILGSKTNERRKNSCWCPVCNEGGSPLDLVLAKNYGIKPSDIRRNKEAYKDEIRAAAHYLNNLFPGGITKIDITPNKKGVNEPIPPNIPWHIIKEIGLKHHPIFDQSEKMNELSKTDRAELLLDKLTERERELWQYAINVTLNFPKLDAKANATIFKQAREWIAEIHPYTEQVRKYYFAIADFEYPDASFMDEVAEDLLDIGPEVGQNNDSAEVEYA